MTAEQSLQQAVHAESRLEPEGPVGRTTGWWAMVLFIATEGATFASAIAAYFYLRFAKATAWPPPSDVPPDLVLPSIATAVLVASVIPMALASRTARDARGAVSGTASAVTLLAGAGFVVLQILDWVSEWPRTTLSKDAYGSLFYTVTGLHTAHVVIGLGMLLFLVVGALVGRVSGGHGGPTAIVALYWYFMAVLAVAVYLTVYITPYL